MNRIILPLISILPLALAACLGDDDPEGDGLEDIQHAKGRWQLDYVCEQKSGMETVRITACSVGDIYDAGQTQDGHLRFGVAWEGGTQGTGVLRSNALSVTFEHGAQNSPDYWTEDAIYTFDRSNHDFFKKSSTYGGNGVSGICAGTAIRIPDEQQECQPRT